MICLCTHPIVWQLGINVKMVKHLRSHCAGTMIIHSGTALECQAAGTLHDVPSLHCEQFLASLVFYP